MPVFIETLSWKPENPTVCTVGSFDGIHLGHRFLIENLIREARNEGAGSLLFTFDPHPKQVLQPDKPIRLLTVKPEKKFLLSEFSGLDYVLFYPFHKAFAAMTAGEFLRFLKENYRVRKLLLGFNHVFGSDRVSDDRLIQHWAAELGMDVKRLPAVEVDGIRVSSTEIKKRLANYDIPTANKLLGYPYMMMGEVVAGSRFGRKIGFPTANLSLPDPLKFIPPDGVYAVTAFVQDHLYKGVMNIGTRPTVDGKNKLIEVYLFDFEGDLYGHTLRVHIHAFLRKEQAFPSIEALKSQIIKDAQRAREVLREI